MIFKSQTCTAASFDIRDPWCSVSDASYKRPLDCILLTSKILPQEVLGRLHKIHFLNVLAGSGAREHAVHHLRVDRGETGRTCIEDI